MKTALTTTAFLLLTVLITACSQRNSEISTTTEVTPTKNKATESDKFKPTKNMVQIDPLRGNYTVKVGQQLYYSASVHGSVGFTASAVSSNNSELTLSDNFIEYNKPQQSGMSGGDAAVEYFIFDVKKVGSYEIVTQKHYRGTLESEHTIKITVENAVE